MKKIFISLMLLLTLNVSTVFAGAGTKLLSMKQIEIQWYGLKDYQKVNLVRIFQRAALDDLGWTAVGMAWEEGKFGRFQMGFPTDGSYDCGILHNNTTSVLKRRGIKRTLYNKVGVCTSLIVNPEESYLEFVKEIRFWQRVTKNGKWKWLHVWKGYNAGYTKGGKNYAKMIGRRIAVIKKYMPELKNKNFYDSGILVIEKKPHSI